MGNEIRRVIDALSDVIFSLSHIDNIDSERATLEYLKIVLERVIKEYEVNHG
jgi:hypothetical protein